MHANASTITRRFWMSFLCCFLSVLSIMAVNTVVDYMPLVFLIEAEKVQGDVLFSFPFPSRSTSKSLRKTLQTPFSIILL